MNELLTVKQLSRLLKVSKMTIYRYIKAGKIEAIKAGRDFRVKQSEYDKFLERHKNK